jgi:hypothetical protein
LDIIANCQHHYDHTFLPVILIYHRSHEYTGERWSGGEEGEGSKQVVDEDEDCIEEK